jgi:hypothetical protein
LWEFIYMHSVYELRDFSEKTKAITEQALDTLLNI